MIASSRGRANTLLTQRAIIEAAAEVADAGGVAAVTMRSVAKVLGVEAMSLYYHLANKDALLDSLADWVFEQITLPDLKDHWRVEMMKRAHSARSVLSKHPWALGMLESRPTPGEKAPATSRPYSRMSTWRGYDSGTGSPCVFSH